MAEPNTELLTPAEVSRMTRLTQQTLAQKRMQGSGPTFLKLSSGRSGRVLYRADSVREWLSQRERNSTSDSGRAA